MLDIKDEILSGSPRYTIRDNNGNVLQDDVQIDLKTPVVEEGTPINKATLSKFIQFENILEYTPTNDYNPATKKYVDDKRRLIAEYEVTAEVSTITFNRLGLTAGDVFEMEFDLYDVASNYITLTVNNDNTAKKTCSTIGENYILDYANRDRVWAIFRGIVTNKLMTMIGLSSVSDIRENTTNPSISGRGPIGFHYEYPSSTTIQKFSFGTITTGASFKIGSTIKIYRIGV